jgi:hypothetical protein
MHPAFCKHFDCSHWWEGGLEPEPAAALYELARRHPRVREHWLRAVAAVKLNHRRLRVGPGHPLFGRGTFRNIILDHNLCKGSGVDTDTRISPSLYWTGLLGLKSWANLDFTERQNWVTTVGYMKGIDLRDDLAQCKAIQVYAQWLITDQRRELLRDKGRVSRN